MTFNSKYSDAILCLTSCNMDADENNSSFEPTEP